MINFLLLKSGLELVAVLYGYHTIASNNLLVRGDLDFIAYLKLHHAVVLDPPHKHLLQFYISFNTITTLTHELDADNDAATGIFGG